MKAIAQRQLLNAKGVAASRSPGAVMGRWSVSVRVLMVSVVMNWIATQR